MHSVLRRSSVLGIVAATIICMGACTAASPATSTITSAPVAKHHDPPSVHTVATSSQSFSHDGTTTGDVSVTCPDGELALGGGYQFTQSVQAMQSNQNVVLIQASRPSGNGWEVRFLYSIDPVDVIAFVQCLVGGSGTIAVQSASLDFPAPPQMLSTDSACPAGTTLVGGGFSERLGISVVEDGPATFSNLTYWSGSFENVSTHDVLAGATVYALCYSLVQPMRFVQGTPATQGVSPGSFDRGDFETSCDMGESLTAGGYANAGTPPGVVYTDAPNAQGNAWDIRIVDRNALITGASSVIVCVAFSA
jgi:hypothetical protein